MAKVDTIKMHIEGKDYVYNINVGKAGIFKCSIDWKVANVLGVETLMENQKLQDLRISILTPYKAYLEAEIQYSVWLGIEYKANGFNTQKKDGFPMFTRHTGCKSFYADGFHFTKASALLFGFKIYIKQDNSTGTTIWHEAEKMPDDFEAGKFDKIYEGFRMERSTTSTYGKVIPYSDKALDTLKKASEGIRGISEILFNFLSQDEELIEEALLGGNLLNQ